MIEPAEVVAERYQITRDQEDEYSYQSQMRTAAGQASGIFDDEIVPLTVQKQLFDKEGNATEKQTVTIAKDECNRADTTLEGLKSLKPVFKNGQWVKEGSHVTAGNASQLSDGASAAVLMSSDDARNSRDQAARLLPWRGGRRLRARISWASARSLPSRNC